MSDFPKLIRKPAIKLEFKFQIPNQILYIYEEYMHDFFFVPDIQKKILVITFVFIEFWWRVEWFRSKSIQKYFNINVWIIVNNGYIYY